MLSSTNSKMFVVSLARVLHMCSLPKAFVESILRRGGFSENRIALNLSVNRPFLFGLLTSNPNSFASPKELESLPMTWIVAFWDSSDLRFWRLTCCEFIACLGTISKSSMEFSSNPLQHACWSGSDRSEWHLISWRPALSLISHKTSSSNISKVLSKLLFIRACYPVNGRMTWLIRIWKQVNDDRSSSASGSMSVCLRGVSSLSSLIPHHSKNYSNDRGITSGEPWKRG